MSRLYSHLAILCLSTLWVSKTAAGESVTFPDGVRVEIVRSEFTSALEHERAVTKKASGFITSHSYTSGTAHYTLRMGFKGGHADGVFHKAAWSTNAQVPALMLLVKAVQEDGKTLLTDHCCLHDEAGEIKRAGGAIKDLSSLHRVHPQVDTLPLHFQISDGADGWRDMDGPVVFDAEDGHAVVSTHVFPRRLPDLRLKVLRSGQPPQVFTLKNPGLRTDQPVLTASPRPYKAQMEDGIYTLDQVGIDHKKPRLRFRPMVGFERNEADTKDKRYNLVERKTSVFDSQGNYYPAGRFMDHIWPLAGEHLFRVIMRIERNEEIYPWRPEHAVIIGTGRAGTVAGELPKAQINEEGRERGFESIEFRPPTEKGVSIYKELAWKFNVQLKGRGSHEKHKKTYLCLFPKAGGVQKEIEGPSAGGSSLNMLLVKLVNFHIDYDWAGDLAPGEEFTVGIITEPDEEAEFVIDLHAAQRFDAR